jgi:aconitate hydratase
LFKKSSLLKQLIVNKQPVGKYIALKVLDQKGLIDQKTLPYSKQVLLEATLRQYDGDRINDEHINLWFNRLSLQADNKNTEIAFCPNRVILQDYTGIPLLTDLAALQKQAIQEGRNPKAFEPKVPVDLVIDHSVHATHTKGLNVLEKNISLEFERNKERYTFIKWCAQNIKQLRVIPPGVGIIHQINLEYLAHGIQHKDGLFFPEIVIGTDSHTSMINGLGIVGWGVGGIEAESVLLGLPMYMPHPKTLGVELIGKLPTGVTTTDLVLTLTQILREKHVVGQFVEYYGPGAKTLSVPERATIANMAPDYGATMGLFPVDEQTIDYYRQTGRSDAEIAHLRAYYQAQGWLNLNHDLIRYDDYVTVNLSSIVPCIAGPSRPEEKIALNKVPETLKKNDKTQKIEINLDAKISQSALKKKQTQAHNGMIMLAGITSCTNTSNPSLLIMAGLLAKNAVQKGLSAPKHLQTSMAPGSQVVTRYLTELGLQQYLDQLGFQTAAYGCVTCVGNVGELDQEMLSKIKKNKIIGCSVLSGNRNFEARIHPDLNANFLMSPPLVIAYALAGSMTINLSHDPLGFDTHNNPVYLNDIWPDQKEINESLLKAHKKEHYQYIYQNIKAPDSWHAISLTNATSYPFDPKSTYIACPPFLKNHQHTQSTHSRIKHARVLLHLGDFVTTDHISPAGRIDPKHTAGQYLREQGILEKDFNTFGARRGHYAVMLRGAFSNPRLKNINTLPQEGGFARHYPSNKIDTVFHVAQRYQASNTPLIIIAGKAYGTGSSRDWAAKATQLLGVKAVFAESFERIHRSNLIGMGVLPCTFLTPEDKASLNLSGDEQFELIIPGEQLSIKMQLTLKISHSKKIDQYCSVQCEIHTNMELAYYNVGGILPYIFNQTNKSTCPT